MENTDTDNDLITENRKRLNRERVAKHYAKHKEKKKAYQRDYRKREKEKYAIAIALGKQTAEKFIDLSLDFTLDEILDIIKNKTEANSNTTKTTLNAVRRIFELAKCSKVLACIRDKEILATSIINATKPDGTPYADNSKKGYFRVIFVLIDQYLKEYFSADKNESEKLKSFYNDYFDNYKLKSNMLTESNQQRIVPSFKSYLDKIKKKFGINSIQYLISVFFSIITVRNGDISDLEIIRDSENFVDNDKTNYLKLNGDISIILNSYKTKTKYKKYTFTLKKSVPAQKNLTNLIIKWLELKENSNREFLFIPKDKISKTITSMTRDIGVEYEQNLFRHMRVADNMATRKDLSPDEFAKQTVALSKIMLHAPLTNMNYSRQLEITENPPLKI